MYPPNLLVQAQSSIELLLGMCTDELLRFAYALSLASFGALVPWVIALLVGLIAIARWQPRRRRLLRVSDAAVGPCSTAKQSPGGGDGRADGPPERLVGGDTPVASYTSASSTPARAREMA